MRPNLAVGAAGAEIVQRAVGRIQQGLKLAAGDLSCANRRAGGHSENDVVLCGYSVVQRNQVAVDNVPDVHLVGEEAIVIGIQQ